MCPLFRRGVDQAFCVAGDARARVQKYSMRKSIFWAAIILTSAWSDTILVEGSSVTRTVTIKGKDVVKIEAVDNTLTILGQGDILTLDGSDNRVTVKAALNGIVITGSSNTLQVVGPLHQLDVRGCDNKITLDGPCDLIQYGGSNNHTRWLKRPGLSQPKVERTGWDNEFQVSNP